MQINSFFRCNWYKRFIILNNFLDVTTTVPAPQNVKCPTNDWILFEEYCYLVNTTQTYQMEAQMNCEMYFGADLASVHNENQNLLLAAHIRAYGSAWLGLMKDDNGEYISMCFLSFLEILKLCQFTVESTLSWDVIIAHAIDCYLPIYKVRNYHLQIWVSTVFGRVCPSVCLSVCLSVQAITFEPLHFWYGYILTISRSSLSIKVIGSRSSAKNDYLLISTCYSFVCGYRSLIRSRSNQCQAQIKVIFKKICSYVGGLHLNQMRSC